MKWVVVVRSLDEHGDLFGDPAAGHQDLAKYAFGSYVTRPMSRAKAQKEAFFIAIRAWGHYQQDSGVHQPGTPLRVRAAAMLAGSSNITAADNPTDFYNLPPAIQRQSKRKRQIYWLLDAVKSYADVHIEILPVGRKNAFK